MISCIRGATECKQKVKQMRCTKNYRIFFSSSIWPLSEFTFFCHCSLSKTAKQLQCWVQFGQLWGCGSTAAVCQGAFLSLCCPHGCLSTDPLTKPHFTIRVWQKQHLRENMSALFSLVQRMWNRMLSTKCTLSMFFGIYLLKMFYYY